MLLLLFQGAVQAGRRVLARLVLRRAPAAQVSAAAAVGTDLGTERAALATMTIVPALPAEISTGAAIRARITAGRVS